MVPPPGRYGGWNPCSFAQAGPSRPSPGKVGARKDRDSRLGSQAALGLPSPLAEMGALTDNRAVLAHPFPLVETGTVALVGSGPGSQVAPIRPSDPEGPNAPTAPYCRHQSGKC